jgi:lactoylglutathione lyase
VLASARRGGPDATMIPEGRAQFVGASGESGLGVSICFICEDALAFYREVTLRGIHASKPFAGNGMWVTSLSDPDGYKIEFESITDVPEDTEYSGREG